MIMKEDFVTYDLAVKLKEKGFRERVRGHYKSENHLSVCSEPMNCNGSASGDISAPQIHEVLKWLRKEKRIDAGAVWDNRDGKWVGYVNEMDMPDLVGEYVLSDTYESYEQAALAGIEYVIDNLI